MDIDKNLDNRLYNGVQRMISLANEGADPTDAMVKVAEEEDYTPEMVKTACGVFNKSKSVAWIENTDPEDRRQNFPLADAKEAVRALYQDEKVASAGSELPDGTYLEEDLNQEPDLEKAAEAEEEDEFETARVQKKAELLAEDVARKLRKADEALEFEQDRLNLEIERGFTKVAESFRTMSPRKQKKAAQVLVNGYHTIGPGLIKTIQARKGVEMPEVEKTADGAVFPAMEPYTTFSDIIDNMDQLHKTREKREELEKNAAGEGASATMDFFLGQTPTRGPEIPAGASGWQTAGLEALKAPALAGRAMQKLYGRVRPAYEPTKPLKGAMEFLGPDVHNALRQLKTKNSFLDLALYDRHLKNYRMDDLAEAFNEAVSVTGIYDNPTMLKPLMLQHLERGGYEDVAGLAQKVKMRKEYDEGTEKERDRLEQSFSEIKKKLEEAVRKPDMPEELKKTKGDERFDALSARIKGKVEKRKEKQRVLDDVNKDRIKRGLPPLESPAAAAGLIGNLQERAGEAVKNLFSAKEEYEEAPRETRQEAEERNRELKEQFEGALDTGQYNAAETIAQQVAAKGVATQDEIEALYDQLESKMHGEREGEVAEEKADAQRQEEIKELIRKYQEGDFGPGKGK